jgi:hypothetical protein
VQSPRKAVPRCGKCQTAGTPVEDIQILSLDDIVDVIELVETHRKTEKATPLSGSNAWNIFWKYYVDKCR